MSIKDEIIRVFKRSVMAYPEGVVVHMGDCHIYSSELGVCTCGLHHWLIQAKEGTIDEIYPQFLKEKTNEGLIGYVLREFQNNNLYVKDKDEFVLVEKPEPVSEEEFNKILDELKGKQDD